MATEIVRIEAGTIFRQVRGSVSSLPTHGIRRRICGTVEGRHKQGGPCERTLDTRGPIFRLDRCAAKYISNRLGSRGYDRSLNGCELLVSDDLADPAKLRDKLKTYIARKAGNRLPFSRDQLDHVREALEVLSSLTAVELDSLAELQSDSAQRSIPLKLLENGYPTSKWI